MTDATVLNQQIPLAVISTYLLQWLKGTRLFPWLTMESQRLNRMAGVVIAFCASVGVLFSFDHAAGVLTISGLTTANLLHVGARFLQQWVYQQGSYRMLVSPPSPGASQPAPPTVANPAQQSIGANGAA
jgi:predicted ferric reductase